MIYKYTEDGYEGLNEKLRISKGLSVPKYGRYLSYVLKKLPNYVGLVYRGVSLTKSQLLAYKEAKNKNKPIVEPTFVSTSKSKLIAGMFGNTLFTILSKRGKSIEELSKYGPSQNEKEVLFNYNSKCMSYYNSLIFR